MSILHDFNPAVNLITIRRHPLLAALVAAVDGALAVVAFTLCNPPRRTFDPLAFLLICTAILFSWWIWTRNPVAGKILIVVNTLILAAIVGMVRLLP